MSGKDPLVEAGVRRPRGPYKGSPWRQLWEGLLGFVLLVAVAVILAVFLYMAIGGLVGILHLRQ